jgi:Ca-activated chloride channel family protein
MSTSLQFQYPWLLALLALLPAYAFLRGRIGKTAALQFSSADIARAAGAGAKSAAGRLLFFLRLLTAALMIVALAGPRQAHDQIETHTSGIDIMLLLDLSYSMIALDMSPPGERVTRLDVATGVLRDFIQKRPNDRIGLIAFSGVPYLASPLTLNHDWLIENLNRLHIGTIRELGTAIGDATAAGARRLNGQKESKSRIIIVLTDGDNNRGEIDPVPAAQLAAGLGMKVYTVGIGIDRACQIPRFDPNTGKLQPDADGNIVPTMTIQPANYEVLTRMSALSKGRSYRATNQRELRTIYDDIDQLEKTRVTLRRHTAHTPLFQWPLLAAVGLLGLELALANTRYRRVP